MKINLGHIARGAVKLAKENPAVALAIVGALSPGLARKVAPVLIPVLTVPSRSCRPVPLE